MELKIIRTGELQRHWFRKGGPTDMGTDQGFRFVFLTFFNHFVPFLVQLSCRKVKWYSKTDAQKNVFQRPTNRGIYQST